MIDPQSLARQHRELSRRYFLQLGAVACSAAGMAPIAFAVEAFADEETPQQKLDRLIARLRYLTPDKQFFNVERGDPLPSELSPEQRAAAGLDRETWQLEILPDAEGGAKVRKPLSKADGTALDWVGLMQLSEKHAVRYGKVMTCNNLDGPLGMGLWEGVPLREVVALARPADLIRRVWYYGYHNDKPEQMFRSSLPYSRVQEDPPGDMPVLVCYKLNGEWLSPKRGGPVRVIVPEAYGFKSVKWLQRIVLTNDHRANDTYADQNNDIESWQKTMARFVDIPAGAKAGAAIPLTGLAQVGVGGLVKVQYSFEPAEPERPVGDPNFTKCDWRDAALLPPPKNWGLAAEFDDGAPTPQELDPQTGKPQTWPLRYTIAHWAALAPGLPAGKYNLRCRTIDLRGVAQPLPRVVGRSGRNGIQTVPLDVTAG
ncbi:MAG TPA: molybdopterin-dependent oxidoreductase [Pirellulales bacterium]|jgi:DMSO/TMAO reductase YedYZ molybdopterin-dependent catalytic subunit